MRQDNRHSFLTALALLYHRHGSPERALLYAVTAAKLDLWSPTLALVLASLFLKLDQPEQAGAVLSRFEFAERLLKTKPNLKEEICACSLMARVSLRTGDMVAARQYVEKARHYRGVQQSVTDQRP